MAPDPHKPRSVLVWPQSVRKPAVRETTSPQPAKSKLLILLSRSNHPFVRVLAQFSSVGEISRRIFITTVRFETWIAGLIDLVHSARTDSGENRQYDSPFGSRYRVRAGHTVR